MEKPEIIYRYTPVQTESDYTSEYYKHEYSIYAVTRDKPDHWEAIRAVYQYMKRLYGKNHPHYERRLQTILYHAEPPYSLIAKFANEELIIWSTEVTVQEQTKQIFTNWQQIKTYYEDLTNYCNKKKEAAEGALQILSNSKYCGKTIFYNPPNIRWKLYPSGLKIKENYIYFDGKSFSFTDFLKCDKQEKRFYWDLFRCFFEYLYNDSCDNYYDPELHFTFDYLDRDNKLILQMKERRFDNYYDLRAWKNVIVLWSNNPADQENTKRTFTNWQYIEQYYNSYIDRWKNNKDIYMINSYVEERIIKTERKIKREQNDPTNPAARKRRARRHLQRLGYDLHKSRKIAKTENDRGQYQIVKLDTGEIVCGKIFDLTLDQVEQFYMDADYARRDSYRTDSIGFIWNKEPNFEQRKEKVQKALQRLGYQLEVDIDDYGYKEYYNASCYLIRLIKNKYKVKCYTDGDNNKFLSNGESKTFTLSEVEAFISSNN